MSRRGRGGNPVSLFAFQDIITSVTGIMILVTLFLALELIRRRQGSPDQQTAALTAELREAAAQTTQAQGTAAAIRRQIDDLKSELAGQQAELSQEARFDSNLLARQLQELAELNQMLAQELDQSQERRTSAEQSLDELKSQDAQRDDDRQQLANLSREAQEKLRELQRLKQTNRVIFNAGQGAAKQPWLVELSPGAILAAQAGEAASPQSFADVKAFLAWAAGRNRGGEYFVLLLKPATIDDFHAARTALEQQGFDVGFDLLRNDQSAIDLRTGAAAP